MRPFLFLGIRAQDAAADDEYAAVLRCAGLEERDVRRVRIERDELEPLDLDDWSGIVIGGGPWNVSDPEPAKDAAQRRGEARLRSLALQVVAADFPFLGACYGIGTLGTLGGGVVDRQYSEPIGAVTITLTPEGRSDPLLGVLPASFDASSATRRRSRRCRAGPSASRPRRPAPCRRSGSERTSTPRSSIPSSTSTAS